MITKEVNKFMALAPLMLPRLIDSKKCAEPDITEDSAILYFSLEETFPIGCVMDMLDDVITRGNSMLRFKNKLETLGATVIAGVSIGKTTHER